MDGEVIKQVEKALHSSICQEDERWAELEMSGSDWM